MTYNIEFGWHWPAARDLIQANPVDVLCLQEVPEAGHPDRTMIRPHHIVEDLGLRNDCVMLWDRPPRRIGNMTLVADGCCISGRRILHRPPSQPYGCAHDVELDGARLTVANIHMTSMAGPPLLTFAPTEMDRLREALDLTRQYRHSTGPVIAMGDFNSFWPAPACCVMRRAWTDCRRAAGGLHRSTRPTYLLPFVIDHVFVRGGISVSGYEVLTGRGSDHRAVVATVEVPVEDDDRSAAQLDRAPCRC